MRKLGFIISALALVLGLAQCAKKPNSPVCNRMITFETTNIGSKGSFVDDGTGNIAFTWAEGDQLYVYASKADEFDESSGEFVGCLDLNPATISSNQATFKGIVGITAEHKSLRFIHIGKEISVTGGACEVSFADQTASPNLADLGGKIIAYMDATVNKENNYGGDLAVQMAIVRFDLSELEDDVVMTGIENNKISVSSTGKITFGVDTKAEMKLKNQDMCYAVMFAQAEDGMLMFKDGKSTLFKTAASGIQNGIFYTATGSSIEPVGGVTIGGENATVTTDGWN